MDEKRIKEIIHETVENFINEYRPHTLNKGALVPMNESNIKRKIERHSDNGYIVISPCRGGSDFGIDPNANQYSADKLAEINRKRVRQIIKDIKDSGFSYTPVYGGFIENVGTDDETNVYERSFIVYNKDKHGNDCVFDGLYRFALDMCRKYNQESFLVQAPGEKPKYVSQSGNIDFEFDGGKVFNDVSKEYFTDLHKNTDKLGDISQRKPTRFSFTETYVNPKPQCYSERHIRWLNGEVF